MKVDKLTRMGRRRFLEAVAALGVTGEGLAHISRPALAETNIDLDNEIPVLVGWRHTNHEDVVENGAEPQREAKYTGVPRDQWIRVESTRDAAKQLRSELNEVGVSVGVTTTTSGHQSRKAVVVEYITEEYQRKEDFQPTISYEELKEELPDTMTGVAGRGTEKSYTVENIPVITEKHHNSFKNEVGTLEINNYDCNYRPVPGGCAWRNEDDIGCTMGTPVYDNDANTNRLVTAAHCFMSYDASECRQNSGGSDRIGYRVTPKTNFDDPPYLFDASVVDTFSSVNVTRDLASAVCDGYRGLSINGSMSSSWLHQMEDDGDYISKQGANTGIASGDIHAVYGTYFEVNVTTDDGDSGCPFYEPNSDGDYFIGGVLRGANPPQVTKMVEIEDRYNVKV